jgi:hypothetical protein
MQGLIFFRAQLNSQGGGTHGLLLFTLSIL